MTSRRCTVLEQGACEQLRLHGYEVRTVPNGQGDKRLPPAYLVASRKSGEMRYIRIYKLSHRPATIDTVEQYFTQAVLRYRNEMARHPDSPIRYEIWLYQVHQGYRCFEILPDRVQQIPPLGNLSVRLLVEGAP